MMDKTKFFTQIRQLIATDELQKAIEQLRPFLENSPKLDKILLQSARFHDIRNQINLGVVNHKEANLTKNQIRAGLLDLIREIEEQGKEASIEQEIEQHLSGKTVIQNADKIYNIDKIDNANFS